MIGVLFDFNGVLFQDSPIHERAWNEFILREADREITAEEMNEFVHGRQNRSALRYVFGESLSDQDACRYSEQKEAIYRQLCDSGEYPVVLSPGATALFDFLALRGIASTIVTSACKSNVDYYFDVFQLRRWFDPERVVFDDGRIPGKPHPAPYLEGAARIGVSISRCLIVEDSVSGVTASKNAGAGYIAGFGVPVNSSGLIAAGADTVFSSFADGEIQNIIEAMQVKYVKN